MYKIVRKKELNPAVTLMEIEAPFVAKKAKAGQFIIFRIDDKGERVPLTIAGYDREKGTVSIIFQKVGLSTKMLGEMNEGDYIQVPWASPPMSRARSGSVWLAAALAAPLPILLPRRLKRLVWKWTSLWASAPRTL